MTGDRRVRESPARWIGWAALVFVVVGFMAVGSTRDSGPRTPDERVQSISQRVACPVCQGESVYESRHPTSENIKDVIEQRVAEGTLDDDEIIESIVGARRGQELLVPTADGVEALAWALPAAAFVMGAAGLGAAFRRWQRNAASLPPASEADFDLVAEALRADRESSTVGPQRPDDPPTSAGDDPVTEGDTGEP